MLHDQVVGLWIPAVERIGHGGRAHEVGEPNHAIAKPGERYQDDTRWETWVGSQARLRTRKACRRRKSTSEDLARLVVHIGDVGEGVAQSPEVIRIHADSVTRPDHGLASEPVGDSEARGKQSMAHVDAVVLRDGPESPDENVARRRIKVLRAGMVAGCEGIVFPSHAIGKSEFASQCCPIKSRIDSIAYRTPRPRTRH